MLIKTIRGFKPKWGENCFFAENSSIIGDVIFGDNCSVWFSSVIRGDVNKIRIGNNVNIQDGTVVHGTYQKSSTKIGNNVSIGHNAIIHGCELKSNVLIGMGSIIMDDSIIKSNSIIAAGSVVIQKTITEENSIYAGIPAKKIKDISEELITNEIERIAKNYIKYSGWYK